MGNPIDEDVSEPYTLLYGCFPDERKDPMSDTIAAIATAPGEGGIAIVRISGPDAESVFSDIADYGASSDYLAYIQAEQAEGRG